MVGKWKNIRNKIEKKNLEIIFLFISILLSITLINGNAVLASSAPDDYLISGVPMHQQITAFHCGPGVIEMIFDFWGADIDQKAIADAARTSPDGTYTWDIVRTGHFSYLSAAEGSQFPPNFKKAGFPNKRMGYASFNYSSNTIWWTDLKALIASNIPVILLMKWAPDDNEGHYRIIVGYDEKKKVVYFMDPWGRDLKHKTNPDGTITWNMSEFKKAWNYSEYGTLHPYWGAVLMPWSIDLHKNGKIISGSTLNITANITYPCPKPFDCTAFPAMNTSEMIAMPDGMHLKNGQSRIAIRDLRAGESANVTWNIHLEEKGPGSWIRVIAEGIVSGEVPEVKTPGVLYPAYDYTDNIGGEARLRI